MRWKAMAFLMVVLSAPAVARGQEEAVTEEDERPAETRRRLRVLDNPYDIASFYRSSQSGHGFYGSMDPYQLRPTPYSGRYPIAGYYRSRQGNYFGLQTPVQNPYAIASYYRSAAGNDVRFWHGGYGVRVRGSRPGAYRRYWNSIGENGDLFLMAPTVLAPVGALSAIYYSVR